MSRRKTRRQVWPWVVLVLIMVPLGVVVLTWLLFGEHSGEATAPEPLTTQEPDVSTTPSEAHDHDDHFEPESPKISEFDCRNFMNEEEYDSFMERVLQFEEVSQMQISDERLELMYPFATEAFMATQAGYREDKFVEGVDLRVDPDSSMGCLMDSNQITARIVPVITVIETSADGTETIVQGPLKLTTHFTRWLQIDGVWYVNQEQF